MADPKLSTKRRVGFAAAPLALIGALVAALGTNDSAHEGRRYTPYYDSAGILTVCAGITGPAVVKGKRYTDDECTRLETVYVRTMLGHMGQCVRGEFELHEIKARGHFAYNIGTPAFCASTAAKRLNAGERQAACTEMWKWRYVTIAGAKRDCALLQWSSKCGGIIDRRQWEMATRALKNYEQHILDHRKSLVNAFAMALRNGDASDRASVLSKIGAFNKANPELAITSSGLRQSIKNRARYSDRAEAGIVLDPRLVARLNKAVTE
ncbi:glycoside hydrolase family protein [Stenotrophomonas sp. Sm6012]|uniref:lysozyme n=1 Tax=Stenotrophomonas sp. Sm6012 TaxID=3002745 RepID=UPI00130F89F0|nr:lysozyme [Stenotrophomonas sp. Sm6012]MDQ7280286.1 glycoside hydrolase family protein [Stenotrophomonas sp. Sm6012]